MRLDIIGQIGGLKSQQVQINRKLPNELEKPHELAFRSCTRQQTYTRVEFETLEAFEEVKRHRVFFIILLL